MKPCFATILTFWASLSCAGSQSQDIVVILHGINRTTVHMQPLAEYLANEGYEVLNIDYPSTEYSLSEIVQITSKEIDNLITDKKRKVNFVGYSMGGLVIRGIITEHRPENLGRVVLLGPPNHGSEVADCLANNFFYKKMYGPAGQQLTIDHPALKSLGAVDYELGIIAGNSSIDPISSLLIPGADDGKVSVESTKLEGMRDHIVIPVSHTFFPSNKAAQIQVLKFLKDGEFDQ